VVTLALSSYHLTSAGSDLNIDGSILLVLKMINFNLAEICRKDVDWIQLENTDVLVIIGPIFEELFVPYNVRQQELVPGKSTAVLLVYPYIYGSTALVKLGRFSVSSSIYSR
jgi:hypothetical protein